MGATTNNELKTDATRKRKGKRKQVPMYHPNSDGKNKKPSTYMILGEIKLIADRFGDRCHKSIMDLFDEYRIKALFGNGWHK